MARPYLLVALALALILPGCASRRVDLLEEGAAVLRVRTSRSADAVGRARRVVEEALAGEQFLDPQVRAGFEASLAGALQVDPAAVLVGQNPVVFPLTVPEGYQVTVGYHFEEPRVSEEEGWVRVRCLLSVSMALLEVAPPAEGSYDALAVWTALGYVARSLQDAGFKLSPETEERLKAPPFKPGALE